MKRTAGMEEVDTMSDEDVEITEIQIAFWFPQEMSLAVAIPFAVYYSLLIRLAISYQIERQRIIEEFYREQPIPGLIEDET